jgi:hypothetical protein
MSRLKDMRLWVMVFTTIVCTSVLGVSMHGALASPKTQGDPARPPTIVSSVTAPRGAAVNFIQRQK